MVRSKELGKILFTNINKSRSFSLQALAYWLRLAFLCAYEIKFIVCYNVSFPTKEAVISRVATICWKKKKKLKKIRSVDLLPQGVGCLSF